MPKSHQAHLEWTPSRLIHWGETIGAATAEVIRVILASRPHPEMGYRAGILRLAKTYSNERLEAASQRALQLQACSYSSLRSILKRSLDHQTTLALEPGKSGPRHENMRYELIHHVRLVRDGGGIIRIGRCPDMTAGELCGSGPNYYDPPTTLLQ